MDIHPIGQVMVPQWVCPSIWRSMNKKNETAKKASQKNQTIEEDGYDAFSLIWFQDKSEKCTFL